MSPALSRSTSRSPATNTTVTAASLLEVQPAEVGEVWFEGKKEEEGGSARPILLVALWPSWCPEGDPHGKHLCLVTQSTTGD